MNIDAIKVSVIIPVFKVEEFLEECLSSVVKQSLANLQIILIDDGSPDKCPEICDYYASIDSRFTVIHQVNSGVSNARNKGLEIATGDFIAFVDSDDIIHPDYLRMLVEHAVDTKSEVIACATTRNLYGLNQIELTNEVTCNYTPQDAIINTLYQKELTNGPHAKIFKRSIINGLRFREDIVIAEDLEFNCRAFAEANGVSYIQLPLYGYRVRQGSALSAKFNPNKMDEINACDIILNQFDSSEIQRAGQNRLFMSALFISVQLSSVDTSHKIFRSRCNAIIKRYRSTVVTDKRSSKIYRLLALMSYINPQIPVRVMKIKNRIQV